jgi:hypothetical protein
MISNGGVSGVRTRDRRIMRRRPSRQSAARYGRWGLLKCGNSAVRDNWSRSQTARGQGACEQHASSPTAGSRAVPHRDDWDTWDTPPYPTCHAPASPLMVQPVMQRPRAAGISASGTADSALSSSESERYLSPPSSFCATIIRKSGRTNFSFHQGSDSISEREG